jgi:glucosylglycerate hydrolase
LRVSASHRTALHEEATDVLRRNDAGDWTRASPHLYPHQWSWDSAFIAIGWAHLDPGRAMLELERLFDAQWPTGMVPHIVYHAGEDDLPYFPGAERWGCDVAQPAPAPPIHTSGLCQPPVHALALQRIWQLTPQSQADDIRKRIRALYPRMLAWHNYLATGRDPESSGLVTVYHPWEGTDNSPRWDSALARIEVGDLGSYTRLDTRSVTDPSQRPTDRDYDRYLWLVELLKQCRFDDAEIHHHYPFQIKDVFFSAVLVAANTALLELASVAEAAETDRQLLVGWIDRGRRALTRRVDPDWQLCLDYDIRVGNPIRLRTFGGFAPLFAQTADELERANQLSRLDSADFCGDNRLRWPLLPSTSPAEPGFEQRNYWRGPVWPVVNWLLWRSLARLGYHERADQLRRAALDQLATAEEFAEYFEPFTGEPLGSPQQSWTAAVALDWLADGSPPP